jgi:hypothetical protein
MIKNPRGLALKMVTQPQAEIVEKVLFKWNKT